MVELLIAHIGIVVLILSCIGLLLPPCKAGRWLARLTVTDRNAIVTFLVERETVALLFGLLRVVDHGSAVEGRVRRCQHFGVFLARVALLLKFANLCPVHVMKLVLMLWLRIIVVAL